MSRRYSPEEREGALLVPQINGSNIPLTSTQTGIPERTLREWRREHFKEQLLPPLPPQEGDVPAARTPPPEFEEMADALKYVRDQIAQETVGMAHTLHETHPILAAQKCGRSRRQGQTKFHPTPSRR